MNQIVDFMQTELFPDLWIENFTYDSREKYGWIVRFAFRLLRKRGFGFPQMDMRRVTFDREKALECFLEQEKDLVRDFHVMGSHVFIGPKQLKAVITEADKLKLFSFTNQYYVSRKLHDMPVTIVPWMEGILIVPKLTGPLL